MLKPGGNMTREYEEWKDWTKHYSTYTHQEKVTGNWTQHSDIYEFQGRTCAAAEAFYLNAAQGIYNHICWKLGIKLTQQITGDRHLLLVERNPPSEIIADECRTKTELHIRAVTGLQKNASIRLLVIWNNLH